MKKVPSLFPEDFKPVRLMSGVHLKALIRFIETTPKQEQSERSKAQLEALRSEIESRQKGSP